MLPYHTPVGLTNGLGASALLQQDSVTTAATIRLKEASAVTAFLDAHDSFLLDCDGVLWAGGGALPGTAMAYGP